MVVDLPPRLAPARFAALLTSSGSLRHALSGLLTSATRFASPRGLKEKGGNHSVTGVVIECQRVRGRGFAKGSVRGGVPKNSREDAPQRVREGALPKGFVRGPAEGRRGGEKMNGRG